MTTSKESVDASAWQRAPEAIGGLIAALGDEDEQLRRLAALSLQKTGRGTVIATHRAFIDQAPSAITREAAEKIARLRA